MQPHAREIDAPLGASAGSADLKESWSARERLATGVSLKWPEWAAISAYATLVAFAIPYHEPWVDEGQAWQMARSLSLSALFEKYIRYEGTPGLWHFFLWVLNWMHVSYTGMHWICGALAVVSISILVLNAPFPRYLKLSLPFTFFLLFQYAVVARSYVLVPPALFVTAWWWKKRPLVVAIALGLLANLSLHAAVISGGLAMVYFVEELTTESALNRARRHLLLCAFIVLGFYAFAIWTAWPPNDVSYLSNARGTMLPFPFSALRALFSPVFQTWILAALFWVAIAVMFCLRKKWLYLLPVMMFAVFCGVIPGNFWHYGLVVPLVISLLWMTWPSPGSRVLRSELVGRAAVICMAGVQILWSGYALYFDHYNAYSPDASAAQFLKPYVEGRSTIAVTYLDETASHVANAVGILPYFDRNIFMNEAYPFYWWSNRMPADKLFNTLLLSNPGIVVGEIEHAGVETRVDLTGPRAEFLMKSGYRLTHVFCGTIPFAAHSAFTNCHLIFEREVGTSLVVR